MGRVNKLSLGQQNTVTLTDEPITLYQLEKWDSNIWQYRFRFNSKPIRRSTGTNDFEKAKQLAKEAYYEIRGLAKRGISPFNKTLNDVYDEYIKAVEDKIAIGKAGKHNKKYYRTCLKYWVELLGKRQIHSIKAGDVAKYEQFRYTYWITGPGATQKKPSMWKARPSDTTWKMELLAFQTLMRFALKKGYIQPHDIPDFDIKGGRPKSRPAFTLKQYRLFGGSLGLKWADQHKHSNYRRKRELFRNYFIFMVLTGMRIGEARELKWKHIKPHPHRPDEIMIHVPEGKTGSRPMVPFHQTKFRLERLSERRHWPKDADKHLGPDDYVFCLPEGKPIRSFHGSFNSLCQFVGITHDTKGDKFTIYSLRHSHAEFAILYGGDVDPITLAHNMGTSVKMLERYYVDLNAVLRSDQLSKFDMAKGRKLLTVVKDAV